MKTCTKCKTTKEETEFPPDGKCGKVKSWCRLCGCAYAKEKRLKDPEAVREYRRNLRLRNPELARAHVRKTYWKNPELARARVRKWRRENLKKCKERGKEWLDKHPGYTRKQKYGLTFETWNEMVLNQGGRCAICEKETKLCVDHDHKTGKVRELLCLTCNQGIGSLKDCSKIAYRAAEYLKKHGK